MTITPQLDEKSGEQATPAGGLRRRAIWIIADQALSSLSNAGLTIGVARVVSDTQYGAFALAFTVYSLTLALSQSVTNQVLVIGYSAADSPKRHRAAMAGAGSAVVVGLAATVILVVAGLLVGIPVRETLIADAIVLPGLLLQDFWRTVFVAFGAPRKAFVNDLIWTVLWALAFAVLIALHIDMAAVYFLAWGLTGVAAAVYGIRQAGARPALGRARLWLLGHRDISVPSFANTLSAMGAIQVGFLIIASIGGVEVVGALRASQTLLGPLNIIGFALSAFAVPEIVRRDLRARGLILAAVGLSGVLVVAAAAWGAILLLLPDSVGRELLGDTWSGTRTTMPGLVLYYCSIVATTGATAVMKALNRMRSVLLTSVILGPLVLAFSVVGVIVQGDRGAAEGFGLAAAVVIVPCWILLVRDARRGKRPVDDVL
ncbi:hypothetical protein [Frondihabitans australicus]|uniref:O-antigen/teichoic acid export membrane protein n=1 Tax=Frondihabitans australicus TaxID=386892 RepID=A0A495ICA2_9MICO|nr:hypothetical protein [Frondihabitans australicus]RKR73552.1 O-antigen/teichoic acid export membrane protein [Frondihabitans australicus]